MSDTTIIPGVLASFSFGCISGSKRDKDLTKEILDEKNAGADAGAWSNRLFPPKACGKRNSFTELKRHLGSMRRYHYESTYVYEDEIWRILPDKKIEGYKQFIEVEGREVAEQMLQAFINDLPNLIDKARVGRGDAFKESDYPSILQIREKFSYTVDYRPIPTGAGLNPAVMAEAIEKLNAMNAARLQQANESLIRMFLEPINLLAEQLKDPTKRKIAPVLATIKEIAQQVPSMDIYGNQELRDIAASVGQTMEWLTPEALKTDEELQKFMGQTCADVVSKFGGFAKLGQRNFGNGVPEAVPESNQEGKVA